MICNAPYYWKPFVTIASFLLLHFSAHASTVVSSVNASGYDSMGNLLTSPPTNGQEVYDEFGTKTGTWSIVTGNSFTADLTETNRNETSNIGYTVAPKSDNTNGIDNHSASFASFNAGADSSDFIVINNEALTMSVSWRFREMRLRLRDMENLAQLYDLNWTITDFVALSVDLGSQTGSQTLNSVGINNDFGFTGFENNTGDDITIVPATFTDASPVTEANLNSLLEYSGSAAGQLTDKYDGSDFTLTLQADHERDTSGATLWDEMMDGDGDLTLGENPRGQLRVYFDASYDYDLLYTTYTLVPVPEPSNIYLAMISMMGLCLRRQRG